MDYSDAVTGFDGELPGSRCVWSGSDNHRCVFQEGHNGEHEAEKDRRVMTPETARHLASLSRRARYAEEDLEREILDLVTRRGLKPAAIAKELGWSRQRMHSWLRSRRA